MTTGMAIGDPQAKASCVASLTISSSEPDCRSWVWSRINTAFATAKRRDESISEDCNIVERACWQIGRSAEGNLEQRLSR